MIASEHVHGCLNCRPDIVPDFDKADPRYHGAETCGTVVHGPAMVDGVPVSYTQGVFEGLEGWALFVGVTAADVHPCPTCATCYTTTQGDPYYSTDSWDHICIEPRFGYVTIACQARGEV